MDEKSKACFTRSMIEIVCSIVRLIYNLAALFYLILQIIA